MADLHKEILEMIESLKNWNRWGSEDQKGCLNFIGPHQITSAARLIKTGKQISCCRTINFFSKEADVEYQASRFMLETGIGREKEDETCDAVNHPRRPIKESISMVFHGQYITHMDSFGHFFWKGKMYPGYDSNLVDSLNGAKKGSIEPLKKGIFGRAILVDVPLLRKIDWVEPGTGVEPSDLEKAENFFNFKVQSGDILLVRTGYVKMKSQKQNYNPKEKGSPALNPKCMKWIFQKEISLLCTDTSNDVIPALDKEIGHPVHTISLCSMGLYLIDNADLEELAEFCQKEKCWTFALSVNPLPMVGTTGSPVNPIALF